MRAPREGLTRLDLAAGNSHLRECLEPRFALPDQDTAVALNDGDGYLNLGGKAFRDNCSIGCTLLVCLEHFRDPRNVGQLARDPALVVDASNPACGDMLRLSARFEDGLVAEARYQTRGCTASIAAGSALTEWITGKSRAEVAALTPATIEDLVGGLEPASSTQPFCASMPRKSSCAVKYP